MFSVVIPYYKKRKYIERCINSVLQQSYQNFEIIVVDDGSNDDIKELINSNYAADVILVQQSNLGVSAARNAGISAAKNDFVAFLDSDDYWSPLYLEKNFEVISKHPGIKIIGSHYSRDMSRVETFNFDVNYFIITDYFTRAIKNTYFTSSSSIVNKKFFEDNSGFNTKLKRGEDIDVWFRAVNSGGLIVYITNTLVYYSDEDINQATNTVFTVDKTLAGVINEIYKPLTTDNTSDFSKFISKYTYLHLFPYFFDKKNHVKAKESLQQNSHYYFLFHLPYYLPYRIGNYILNKKFFFKLIKIYFKFISRFIYG